MAEIGVTLVPAILIIAIVISLAFAAVAVFGRRWRLGSGILGVGLILTAIPFVLMGVLTDGTPPQIVGAIVRT